MPLLEQNSWNRCGQRTEPKVNWVLILLISGEEGEEEEDDPDFDPSKVKPGQNAQECKQQ